MLRRDKTILQLVKIIICDDIELIELFCDYVSFLPPPSLKLILEMFKIVTAPLNVI